jgi:hypothetical protein
MGKKKLESCKTNQDYQTFARQNNFDVFEGKNHTRCTNSRGGTSVPRHPGEIDKNMRRVINKQFLALLAALPFIGLIIYQFAF